MGHGTHSSSGDCSVVDSLYYMKRRTSVWCSFHPSFPSLHFPFYLLPSLSSLSLVCKGWGLLYIHQTPLPILVLHTHVHCYAELPDTSHIPTSSFHLCCILAPCMLSSSASLSCSSSDNPICCSNTTSLDC